MLDSANNSFDNYSDSNSDTNNKSTSTSISEENTAQTNTNDTQNKLLFYRYLNYFMIVSLGIQLMFLLLFKYKKYNKPVFYYIFSVIASFNNFIQFQILKNFLLVKTGSYSFLNSYVIQFFSFLLMIIYVIEIDSCFYVHWLSYIVCLFIVYFNEIGFLTSQNKGIGIICLIIVYFTYAILVYIFDKSQKINYFYYYYYKLNRKVIGKNSKKGPACGQYFNNADVNNFCDSSYYESENEFKLNLKIGSMKIKKLINHKNFVFEINKIFKNVTQNFFLIPNIPDISAESDKEESAESVSNSSIKSLNLSKVLNLSINNNQSYNQDKSKKNEKANKRNNYTNNDPEMPEFRDSALNKYFFGFEANLLDQNHKDNYFFFKNYLSIIFILQNIQFFNKEIINNVAILEDNNYLLDELKSDIINYLKNNKEYVQRLLNIENQNKNHNNNNNNTQENINNKHIGFNFDSKYFIANTETKKLKIKIFLFESFFLEILQSINFACDKIASMKNKQLNSAASEEVNYKFLWRLKKISTIVNSENIKEQNQNFDEIEFIYDYCNTKTSKEAFYYDMYYKFNKEDNFFEFLLLDANEAIKNSTMPEDEVSAKEKINKSNNSNNSNNNINKNLNIENKIPQNLITLGNFENYRKIFFNLISHEVINPIINLYQLLDNIKANIKGAVYNYPGYPNCSSSLNMHNTSNRYTNTNKNNPFNLNANMNNMTLFNEANNSNSRGNFINFSSIEENFNPETVLNRDISVTYNKIQNFYNNNQFLFNSYLNNFINMNITNKKIICDIKNILNYIELFMKDLELLTKIDSLQLNEILMSHDFENNLNNNINNINNTFNNCNSNLINYQANEKEGILLNNNNCNGNSFNNYLNNSYFNGIISENVRTENCGFYNVNNEYSEKKNTNTPSSNQYSGESLNEINLTQKNAQEDDRKPQNSSLFAKKNIIINNKPSTNLVVNSKSLQSAAYKQHPHSANNELIMKNNSENRLKNTQEAYEISRPVASVNCK